MAITPVFSASNTQQSTANTTFTATDVSIAGATLGTAKYLVLFAAGYGNSGNGIACEAQAVFGATEFGRTRHVSLVTPIRESLRAYHVAGIFSLTGDGAAALAINHRSATAGTSYIAGKSIIAIPLTQLVENTDYFDAATNNASNVATSSSAVYVDVLSQAFTLPSAGDYLVLASMESDFSGPNPDSTSGMRITVDGTISKRDWLQEVVQATDRYGLFHHRVHNLAAGSHTFVLQGQRALGAGTIQFHRPRIFVIRLAAFLNVAHISLDALNSSIVAYPSFTDFTSVVFTPSETQDVVAIGSAYLHNLNISVSTAIRLRNTTDAVSLGDSVGGLAEQTTAHWSSGTMGVQTAISSAKTFALQACDDTVDGDIEFGDLIVLGMSLAPTADPQGEFQITTTPAVVGVSSGRKRLDIRNLGGQPVFVGNSTVTPETGMLIKSGGSISLSVSVANEDVYLVCAATSHIRFLQTF